MVVSRNFAPFGEYSSIAQKIAKMSNCVSLCCRLRTENFLSNNAIKKLGSFLPLSYHSRVKLCGINMPNVLC